MGECVTVAQRIERGKLGLVLQVKRISGATLPVLGVRFLLFSLHFWNGSKFIPIGLMAILSALAPGLLLAF
jgi:hypothetical protein